MWSTPRDLPSRTATISMFPVNGSSGPHLKSAGDRAFE